MGCCECKDIKVNDGSI